MGMDYSLSPHITEMLLRLADNPSEDLELAVRLVGERLEEGHICLDLRELAGGDQVSPDDQETRVSTLQKWRDLLRTSGVVGLPEEYFPLILDSHLLYFHRYYEYEKQVAACINSRRGRYTQTLDLERLRSGLDRLFPSKAADSTETGRQGLRSVSL